MALLIKSLIQSYDHAFNDLIDPRTADYFNAKSPIWLISVITIYVLSVKHIGPMLMENRKPFNVDKLLIVYNVIQIILNSYIFYMGSFLVPKFNVLCSPVDRSVNPETTYVLKLMWLFCVVKHLDLLDTVFFVLRKNWRQISFLHVYHHSAMLFCCWIGIKYYPGGHSFFIGYINSFIHIVMYSYYLLTVFNKNYKRSLWWKKHLTQLQLVQFVLLLFIYSPNLFMPSCKYTKLGSFLLTVQSILMIAMFGNFYYKNYVSVKKNE